MSFVAPGIKLCDDTKELQIIQSGWIPTVHPDFLWNTVLAKTIKQYDFWDYPAYEALFMSEKEEPNIINILQNIR